MAIKVSELKELRKNMSEEAHKIDFNGLQLEVKSYLPIEKKVELAYIIYHNSIDEQDGVVTFNQNNCNIATTYFVTEYYSNVSLPKSIFEAFDLLVETGLFIKIYETIESEVKTINNMVANIHKKEEDLHAKKAQIGNVVKSLLSGMDVNALLSSGLDLEGLKGGLEHGEI